MYLSFPCIINYTLQKPKKTPTCLFLRRKQDQWTRQQIRKNKDDPFWRHAGYIIAQLDGLYMGALEWAKLHKQTVRLLHLIFSSWGWDVSGQTWEKGIHFLKIKTKSSMFSGKYSFCKIFSGCSVQIMWLSTRAMQPQILYSGLGTLDTRVLIRLGVAFVSMWMLEGQTLLKCLLLSLYNCY